MGEKADIAVEYRHKIGNCCQSMLLTYGQETGLSEEELCRIGACFATGFGNMDGVCGALCGAEMLYGLLRYGGKPLRAEAGRIEARFKELSGSVICGELKGIDTKKPLCSCDDCIRNAVRALEEELAEAAVTP